MTKIGFSVVAAVAFAASARADDRGVALSLRAGLGGGIGKVADGGSTMSQLYSQTIPVWFEATYRFDPSWSAGLYGQYAFAPVASFTENAMKRSAADAGLTARDFTGRVLRLGAEGSYRFVPQKVFAPWIGLGVGYEWAEQSFTIAQGANTADANLTLKGFDFMVQAGGDYRLSPSVTIGPFAAFTFGWYSEAEANASALGQSQSRSANIDNKKLHDWIQAGIRGTFELGR